MNINLWRMQASYAVKLHRLLPCLGIRFGVHPVVTSFILSL